MFDLEFDFENRPGTLAEAGVNILVQYSEHHIRLVLVCDREEPAQNATLEWAASA